MTTTDAEVETYEPRAYLIGSKSRPEQIVIYGVTGGAERCLRIPLDLTKPPITYAMQALTFVRNMPRVPFWGDTRGYVINYSSNFAVVFNVSGNPIEVLRHSYMLGHVQIEIGSRRMSGEDQRLICSTRRAGNF